MSDFVEKVAKVICESEDGGVWEQHRWDAGSYWHNEYERMARASIAVVLEDAARIAENIYPGSQVGATVALEIRAKAKEVMEWQEFKQAVAKGNGNDAE